MSTMSSLGERWHLPGGILAALIRPLVTPFVVDLPHCEQPFPIGLNQLVLIVPEPVEDAPALRVVVGVVEPVRASECLVAVALLSYDIRDVVSGGCGSKPGRTAGFGILAIFDRLATLYQAAAVIEYSVRCEGRDIRDRDRESRARRDIALQVLNRGAILA